MVGALATGVFATTSVNPAGAEGVLAGNISLLVVQGLAVLATVAFSGGMTFLLLKAIDRTVGLRSSSDEDREGLDLVEHGEQAYHELM